MFGIWQDCSQPNFENFVACESEYFGGREAAR